MRIYFDHAASTPCDPRVVEAMMPYFTNDFGNGDSQHSFGRDTAKAIADARTTIAKLINCQPNELYFTASGTESDNWALKGAAFARKNRGNHIIISALKRCVVLFQTALLCRSSQKCENDKVSNQN